ncbi:hypothetical protein [Embleya sp. MST-111070]|uniref:hypothetical protein n=1 Tax=Embleya sp. MST-111070 TaxID=3398231 RepID=UPI003F73A9F4
MDHVRTDVVQPACPVTAFAALGMLGFDAHRAGAPEHELEHIIAGSLQETYFRDGGIRAGDLAVEFTDVDYILIGGIRIPTHQRAAWIRPDRAGSTPLVGRPRHLLRGRAGGRR